jgi:DNA-binding HxlR family transcriptional regulator/CheY-like chemotaxis protein
MADLEYSCPVEVTLEVIGGKWKCVILWWLRRDGKRFGELKLLIPEITQKVLTQQLRELERDGLIRRETFREVPPRVEYSLTSYGETLRPITELMCEWGKTHKPEYQFGALRLQGLQILVVSGEITVREHLQNVLEERSAQVIAASSAATALTALQQIRLDALVVDIGTLGEDGYTLIRQVRSLATNLARRISAIALTTSDMERRQIIQAGFQIHLAKPFEPIELIAALSSLTSAAR